MVSRCWFLCHTDVLVGLHVSRCAWWVRNTPPRPQGGAAIKENAPWTRSALRLGLHGYQTPSIKHVRLMSDNMNKLSRQCMFAATVPLSGDEHVSRKGKKSVYFWLLFLVQDVQIVSSFRSGTHLSLYLVSAWLDVMLKEQNLYEKGGIYC